MANRLTRYEHVDNDSVKKKEATTSLTFTDVLKSTTDRALDEERSTLKRYFDQIELFSDMNKFIVKLFVFNVCPNQRLGSLL